MSECELFWMIRTLFWVSGDVWGIILGGCRCVRKYFCWGGGGWVGMSGSEWGWVGVSEGGWGWMRCLIMPDRKISFEIWRCLKYGGSNYGKSLIIVC